MNPDKIHEKFGGIYIASERTFRMGIDKRFTTHFAQRFRNMNVLETCTGGGFTTLSLAGTARHVFTVEKELDGLRPHEREKLYRGDRQELNCLYFGDLVTGLGAIGYRIPG